MTVILHVLYLDQKMGLDFSPPKIKKKIQKHAPSLFAYKNGVISKVIFQNRSPDKNYFRSERPRQNNQTLIRPIQTKESSDKSIVHSSMCVLEVQSEASCDQTILRSNIMPGQIQMHSKSLLIRFKCRLNRLSSDSNALKII